MNGVYAALAIASMVVALGTSARTMYKGWRNRVSEAAKRPFISGQEAINEAELALSLKDRRLAEAAARENELTAKNAELEAQNSAQQGQITDLYTKLGQVTAKNAQLGEQLAQAAEREQRDRARIGALETELGEIRKQIGLGAP